MSKISEISEISQEEGNTKPPLRSRKWHLTLNNYTEDEWNDSKSHVTSLCDKYVLYKEVCPKTGTPHMHMYISYKHQHTFTAVKKLWPRAHIEIAKGNEKDQLKYGMKEGDFLTNIGDEGLTVQDKIKKKLLKEYKDVVWRPWQQQVLDIVNGEKNSRIVNWVYDPKGNSGKSFLTKYIALNNICLIADGKKDNVFNQLNDLCNEKDLEVGIIVLDIPRHNQEYLNYGMIEQLKDGLVYSGKYQGGMIFLDKPHVIVFSNSEPEYDKFTMDRWNIIHVV